MRLFLCVALTASPLCAQHSFSSSGSTYDPKIPTPRALLGYEIGEQFTSHQRMMRYVERIAAVSPRVRVDTVAHSFEGREMLVIAIGSEANIARLGEIQRDAQRLADPRNTPNGNQIADRLPVIVWLEHSVHGGEASGVEAGLALLYQLAAGTDAETRLALDSAIVLIDPNENPDGRERHVHDVQRMRGMQRPSIDGGALNNAGSWPGPRTSHYYFDLNRDWFILSHPETRGRVATFMKWWPHVAVDLHEMGSSSTFYFAPPMEPNNANNPSTLPNWFERFGIAHKEAFDEHGWSFFRREGYDSFYPGYGESWPMLTGTIGMLFESASSSGGAIRRVDGTVRTLRDAAHNHYVAEWTTVRYSAKNRGAIVRDYLAARREAIARGERAYGGMRAIVFERDHQGRGDSLAARLIDNGIEVQRLTSATELRDATLFGDTQARTARAAAGWYVVDLAQPQGNLARAILEPDAALDSAFIQRELESRRTALPDRFYDVTAWSLPYAFRVRAWTTRTLPPAMERLTTIRPEARETARGRYGYAFEPGSEASIRLLASLLRDSVRVWYAPRAFTTGSVRFPRGAFVVRAAANDTSVHSRVARQASAAGARVTPLASAGVEEGIDLGSGSVMPLTIPRVALLGGPPVGGGSFGFAWYALDQRMGFPISAIDAAYAAGNGLDNYNVLIVPSTTGGALDRALGGDAGRQRVADCVRGGGVLITLDAATAWAAGDRGVMRAKLRRDTTRADSAGGAPLPSDVPGAIARVSGDTLSPLMAGVFETDFAVLVNSDRVYTIPKDLRAGEAVVRYAPDNRLRLSGYFWPEVPARLALSPYLWTERVGRGRIIAFAGDPVFRDHWRGTYTLFANAVLLGASF
ncbi:MAG TPA: M14 family zinc carboxypeptidase [Gemmatimonadaceae bacterium]|nr:M14 family zinc carboxypeptidase [Gemmatimonadaceae bacterium]